MVCSAPAVFRQNLWVTISFHREDYPNQCFDLFEELLGQNS